MRVQQLFDLSNKSALVTGGGRGTGRFIAKGLAEAGATVFIASRKLENCQTVVDEIKADGGKAIAVKADVGKKEDIDALADIDPRHARLAAGVARVVPKDFEPQLSGGSGGSCAHSRTSGVVR